MPTEEESKWEEAAKEYDGGKGLPLEEYDPDDSDDMVLLYDALKVNDPYAKLRLRRFIRRLREPKETASQRPFIQQEGGTASALVLIEQKLDGMNTKLDDMNTIDVPMSEATMDFTTSLLEVLNIRYNIHKVNTGVVEGQMQTYQWGEKEHEQEGQPACQNILENEILPLEIDDFLYGIYDIRGRKLPELQGGKRKSNGFSDMAVGPKTSMDYAATFAKDLVLSYAVAFVELKTARADLKQGQLLLQLIALSMISNMGQGAVVLGTDCTTKWRLLHFSSYNNIVVQPYSNGKNCLADFKKLIAKGAARMQQNTAPKKLTRLAEGSDEDGFIDMADFGLPENSRDAAISRENKIRKLAGALGSLFGENLEVPYWAKASETCPSYYT